MDTPYPNMQDNPNMPFESGDDQPVWQALVKKMPPVTDLRVLVIHCGDGWFCRYALNHGAAAVLGIDTDTAAIQSARAVASSDRLRYRIMPDHWLKLLTGPYDLIVGAFNQSPAELRTITHVLSQLLSAKGQLIAAVAPPKQPTGDQLAVDELISSQLVINRWFQVTDKRLTQAAQLYLLLSSRVR
ncbi:MULTISPECIES: class I SAM-dependent methyltransferase [Lacticaseibacillus]|uniref:Class I SAM-dependent methyltransferase n=3 Tax=Lacticaseibacillus zeae TaxID=57037 RepID=A0A5R8LXL8_LACZE|nr:MULTISPECIES: class I SAM-dependent methyltransferase [Lacticaseibacillus]OFR93774.1 SAM-dependent methyltransferase [Lactobacillus sp. HMSC068F07]KLI75939.1 SAM-dependent methyltransferase [Lacticaseibacillus casei]MDE3283162.1 class I SAM-dependent methyltransferase [Lacticaseibacillus casei]MDE3315894.1 class I SAM-dependent methyltransferase [Lacticaseibacillus zeae]OLS09795.1 SAM-dependent methyltransferase [Lacticaseibacillus casei]